MTSSPDLTSSVFAATTGGLRGALTVLGTLAFVGICFGLVELVDRRQSADGAVVGRSRSTSFARTDPAPDTYAGSWPRRFASAEHDGATRRQTVLVASLGAVSAVVVALGLAPVRSAVGPASVALALVLVVVAAAAEGGRVAAGVTSAAAALAFNFLHAAPLYSFHLRNVADVVTSVLMVLVGVAVGEVAVRRFRTAWEGSSARSRLR
jgi:K+-sensing histidine kinase KdpD